MRRANANPTMKTGELKRRFNECFMVGYRPRAGSARLWLSGEPKSTDSPLGAQSARDPLRFLIVVLVSYEKCFFISWLGIAKSAEDRFRSLHESTVRGMPFSGFPERHILSIAVNSAWSLALIYAENSRQGPRIQLIRL